MRVLLTIATALIVLAPAAGQQGGEGRAVIRSDARLVLVDTVVTDKNGKYVRNLRQKDFKVYEDGREQSVNTFSAESSQPPGNSPPRYLVLFFDVSNSSPSQLVYARRAATQFVENSASPNRLMAIAEFSGSLRITQDFTADSARLKAAVAGTPFSSVGSSASAPSGNPRVDAAFNDFSVRSVLRALRTLAKGLSQIPGRKTLVFLSGGFPMTIDTNGELIEAIDACNRANVAVYPVDIRGLFAPTGELRDERRSRLAGLKALLQNTVLFHAPVIASMEFQSRGPGSRPPLAGGGGKPGGTVGAPSRSSSQSNSRRNLLPPISTSIGGRQQVLYVLANATGGFVVLNTNDLLGGLEEIGKEQNEYYILGYAPSREADPGACHTLKVKVARDGAAVRSRSGYCEPKALDLLSGTPAERDLKARIRENAPVSITDASMLTPFFYIAANKARVNLVLDIPAGTFRFAENKGKFRAAMNLVGIAYLPDGNVGARFSDTVKWSFDRQNEAAAVVTAPYRYEKQFEIASGNYTLKVAFTSAPEHLGRLEKKLTIEPWTPDTFTISSLALCRNVRPAADAPDESLEDRVPLIADRVRILPAGSNRFKKSQTAYVYAEIYEPALAKLEVQEAPWIVLQMQLLDPNSAAVKKDFGNSRVPIPTPTGNPAVPAALMLNAPDVPSGIYRLRLTARDSAGHSVARSIGIQLED